MGIIKIQFNKQIRKYSDNQNIQLGKIYSFIMKQFENVPTYFELQYRHPLNKIKRQLMNNEQLQDLLSIKSNITLIVKPIICENISRYQICRKQSELLTQQSQGIFSDMALLLERLSLHQSFTDNSNQVEKENKHFLNKFFVQNNQEEEDIESIQKREECLYQQGVNNNIIQDEKDFLIKDETNEYVEQMFCLSSDDDSSEQIELNF